MEQNKNTYIGYEYKEVAVKPEYSSFYSDCYQNFGWQVEGNPVYTRGEKMLLLRLKRDRKITNKTELTRLQRHFEACASEIETMERHKTSQPLTLAICVGLVGTVFMAGATFAVTHDPPLIRGMILLAIPGLLGWIMPYFLYQNRRAAQTKKIQPLIEHKQENIYEICEKGHALL